MRDSIEVTFSYKSNCNLGTAIKTARNCLTLHICNIFILHTLNYNRLYIKSDYMVLASHHIIMESISPSLINYPNKEL